MQLSAELAATGNIETIEAVSEMIDQVLDYSQHYTDPGLQLLMTGSAAFGGETLIAARDAIRYTEWITVVMILMILAFVYRSPLLVAIPMISIGFAVAVSTSLVSIVDRLVDSGHRSRPGSADLYDQSNLCSRDPVRCGNRLLSVLDCSAARRSSQGRLGRRLPQRFVGSLRSVAGQRSDNRRRTGHVVDRQLWKISPHRAGDRDLFVGWLGRLYDTDAGVAACDRAGSVLAQADQTAD